MLLTKFNSENFRTEYFKDLSDSDLEFELYKKDITLEISWLLNAISPKLENYHLYVLDYGIPDFVHLSPDSMSDIAYLKREILLSIRRFERRLENPSIEVNPSKNSKNRLDLLIKGKVKISGVYQDFSVLFGI